MAAIHEAANAGDLANVQRLLAEGVSINGQDRFGQTPIYFAARSGMAEVVLWLAKEGADLDMAQNDGVTPLRIAAATGHKAAVEALIAAGANPTVKGLDGRTAWDRAMEERHHDLAVLLRGAEEAWTKPPVPLLAAEPRSNEAELETQDAMARSFDEWQMLLRASEQLRSKCSLLELQTGEQRATIGLLEAEVARLSSAQRIHHLEMARLQASILPQQSRYSEYGLHNVPLDSPTGMFVCNLLESTVVPHRLELRAPDFAPAPRLRVRRVEKISNARLYDKYMTAVSDLEGLYRECGCENLSDVFQNLRVHPASIPIGRPDLNELFAFHGAEPTLVQQICKAGFDPRRAGEAAGKIFGLATYFAVNSSKSDMYTDWSSRLPRSAERKVILARLVLGRSLRVTAACGDWTRPPDGYDSIWADSRDTGGCVDHREIMVYTQQQALPLFVITYVHECPTTELCSECRRRPA